MNAAAKALAENSLSFDNIITKFFSKKSLGTTLLIIAVLFSALAIVYVRQLDRQLFMTLQTQQHARDNLHVEWSQLLLEQSAWGTQSRVQTVAQGQLDMTVPKQKNIILVRD